MNYGARLFTLDLDARVTAGWSKSFKILAFLQESCGIGQSSMDSEWCYGPGWLHAD